MKKLVLPVITLIIGLVAGYYFANSKHVSTDAVPGQTFRSENSITREEAQMLVDTFGMYGLQDATHKIDEKGIRTRASFIPIKMLDTLVAALDAEKKHGIDGLRIYFGRYPKLGPDQRTPYQMPFHNTIILVSTKATRILPKGGKDSITIHLDYFGAKNSRTLAHSFCVDPQNKTDICPDACDGATLVCPDSTDTSCTGCSTPILPVIHAKKRGK